MTRTRRLVVAQSLDALTFAWFYVFIGATIHAERNPVVLALMALGGIQLVIFTKVGISLWIDYRARMPVTPSRFGPVRAAYPVMSLFMVSLATACGIVGAGFNLAAILSSI